jgi:predicted dehydrogenase
MRLKVGLIGLGDQWETRHRPALLALSDRFDVRAICCEVAQKGERVARDFGAVAVDGFRAMINRDDVEAVLTLAPDWVGPLPILAACEAGKAVYSSAALDIAPEQVGEIRKRVEKSGVAFMAELPRRFAPATIRLKELMATKLGRATQMFCHERMTTEAQTSHLRRGKFCPLTWRSLMEQVDWCCYLVGRDPTAVLSNIHRPVVNGHSTFYQSVTLCFDPVEEGDLSASSQLSVGYYIPACWNEALAFRRPSSIQILCENGVAFIDLPSSLVWFDEAGQHTESLDSDRSVGEQMLMHFHRAVTSLVRNTTDLTVAWRAMKIVIGANASAQSGRKVPLEF